MLIILGFILTAIWTVMAIWPRRDGGGIGYSIVLVLPHIVLIGYAAIWAIVLPLHWLFG